MPARQAVAGYNEKFLAQADPKRIVIIDWSMIGDLIMLSPCVRAVRRRFPEAHLAVLGQPSSIASYKHHPGIDQLIPYDRSHGDFHWPSFRQAMLALRESNFELALIFHNSFGSALMAWMARIRERVGYSHEGRGFLLTKRWRIPEQRQHLIETKADLLRMYGVPVEDLSEEVHYDKAAAKVWLKDKLGPNFGRNRPVVSVCLGATREYKQWDAKGLNTFLNLFPVNSCDFVFLGAPGDAPLFESVYSYNNTVVNLVGQTTIEELTWVLSSVDLHVGPDSGPVHFATACRTPVVALFGPTDPALCGPYQYEPAVVVRAERICRRCEAKHGKHIRQCLHTVDPNEVYFASVGLLARFSSKWSFELA